MHLGRESHVDMPLRPEGSPNDQPIVPEDTIADAGMSKSIGVVGNNMKMFTPKERDVLLRKIFMNPSNAGNIIIGRERIGFAMKPTIVNPTAKAPHHITTTLTKLVVDDM